ncbi:MAG: cyclic nucleotide-binding domain-containing protein, partial [Magnetovibrio sp.]|nr:cyclic nucleotide-binding domain-containing protein [Magnetovibrio sp.]
MNIPGLDKTAVKTFADGKTIIKEGAEGFLSYKILDGRADVVKASPTGYVQLATLSQGESFGEISALTKRPATTSVIARGPLSVQLIDRDTLLEHVRSNPDFAAKMFDQQAHILTSNQATIIGHYTDILDKERSKRFSFREWMSKDKTIQAFEPDYIRIEQERPPFMVQLTGYLISAFIIFTVAWTYYATVDVVVLTRGKSVASHDSIGVHAPTSGRLVEAVFKNGQVVKAGDVLAKVDQTLEKIDAALNRNKYSILLATQERMNAELDGEARVQFSDNPNHNAAQRALFATNQAAYKGMLDEKQAV